MLQSSPGGPQLPPAKPKPELPAAKPGRPVRDPNWKPPEGWYRPAADKGAFTGAEGNSPFNLSWTSLVPRDLGDQVGSVGVELGLGGDGLPTDGDGDLS